MMKGSCIYLCCVTMLLVLLDVCIMYPDVDSCPYPSHRKFRKAVTCNDKMVENYSCLLNEINNTYIESCTEAPDFVRRGHKYVYRGGRDSAICSDNRFQPFNFWSNESSHCIFLKHTCSELGQIVFNNGSSTTDSLCRCDYRLGFSFVKEPQHLCYCIPSEEDCTCMIKSCLTQQVLSPDYICIQKNSSRNGFNCSILQETISINTTTENRAMLEKDITTTESDSYRIVAATTLLTAALASAVIIGTLVKLLYFRTKSDDLNIIHVHREFLVEEMDTDAMMSALKKTFVGDRVEVGENICSYLEKKFYNINKIGKFLEILKKEKMNYIHRRLYSTQQIFSCKADVSELSKYILKIKSGIVSYLHQEEQCLKELNDFLQKRHVILAEEICINSSPTNDETVKFIDKIRQKGRFAMLTLVEALCIINQNKTNSTEIPKLKVNKRLIIIHNILLEYGVFKE